MNTFKKLALASALLASVLAGCGGGGSGGSAATGSGAVLSGTAAVGSPIAGGAIAVTCASGSAVPPTNTSSTGAWSVTLSDQALPCAVQVSGGTINGIANTTLYHSIASAAGTVNVTPITDLIVANLAGTGTPSIWFSTLNAAALTPLNAAAVAAAINQIKTALALPALTALNPLTVSFNPASGNAMDDVLTALQGAIVSNGTTLAALKTAASSATFIPPVGFTTALTTTYGSTASGNTGSTTTAVPSAPTGLTATAISSTQINLSWTAVAGATGYNVFSSISPGVTTTAGNQSTTSPLTVLTYSSTGRTAATTYYYKVTALNSAGASIGSAEATATTSSATNGGGSTAGTLSVSTLKWDDGAASAFLQKSMTDAVVGTVVEIAGTGFEDGKMQVTLGGGKIASVQFVSATKIRVKIPLDATDGAVTVLHTGSQASVTSATSITIDPTSCGSTSLASVAGTTVPFVAAAPSLGSTWVDCGTSWYRQNLGLGQQIIWDGSQFINEFGGTSSNGYAWSRGTATTQFGTAAQIFSLASNGSVVVGIDSSQGVNQILYGKYLPGFSALTWAVPALPVVVGAYEVQSVSQANGVFFVTTNSKAAFKSSDGINWTSTQDYLGTVQWNGAKYLGFNAISATSTNPTTCISTDATTWTCSAIKQSSSTSAPTGIDLTSIAFDGTNYFAMASNAGISSMWKSADGITWTKFTITVSGVAAGTTFKNLMWTGNQFIAIGQDATFGINSRMLTSVDAVTWTGTDLASTTSTPNMKSIAYSPSLKRAVVGGLTSGANAKSQLFVSQ